MINMQKHEAHLFLSGKANGLSRPVDSEADGAKYKIGHTDAVIHDGEVIGHARIMSIRFDSFQTRLRDDRLAKADGYTNLESWEHHWRTTFGGEPKLVMRIQYSPIDASEAGP